jgi:hypothetical protein
MIEQIKFTCLVIRAFQLGGLDCHPEIADQWILLGDAHLALAKGDTDMQLVRLALTSYQSAADVRVLTVGKTHKEYRVITRKIEEVLSRMPPPPSKKGKGKK